MLNTNKIWVDFKEPLRRYIAGRVQNKHDAEDILQDIFLKAYRNLSLLKDEDKSQAWLFQIARNTVIDYYRRQKTGVNISGFPEDSIIEPAAAIDKNQNIIPCLRSMIGFLPEKYRQAIVLSEFDGLTQRDLAEKTGLSLSGAKSRVQRARKELKSLLTDCCQFEFDRLGNILDYRHKGKSCPHCISD